jgi:mannose-6-phosphate isomerase-like protein (cupin superfamily)
MYVIHEPGDVSFEKAGVRGKIFPAESLSPNVEFVLIETKLGHETTIIENGSMFAYYVLEGVGFFEIEGKREDCAAGDLVIIPAGKRFSYKGKLRLLLASNPPWRAEQEVTL